MNLPGCVVKISGNMLSKKIFLTTQIKRYFATNISQRPDLNVIVSEAKKLVGYSSCPPKMKWLANDKAENNVAVHLTKLVETNHQLLESATNLIYNRRNNTQAWDVITLLISKAAGHQNVNLKEDEADGILHDQRALAEITEMIRAGYLIHREIINTKPGVLSKSSKFTDGGFSDNIVTLLSGDYLFCYSFAEIAAMRNQELIELVLTAVCKLSESEFIGRRDNQNNPIPPLPMENRQGYAVREWTLLNELSGGELLAKSCQGALKLGGHDEDIQSYGYRFGKHLALAWQASLDLNRFIGKNPLEVFSLYSAPVMFHIEHDPSILNEVDKGLESVHNVDYGKIFDIVNKGPGIELTKQLQKNHSQKATEMLSVFNDGDAKTALFNIISAVGNFSV